MKTILSLVLALVVAVSIFGCAPKYLFVPPADTTHDEITKVEKECKRLAIDEAYLPEKRSGIDLNMKVYKDSYFRCMRNAGWKIVDIIY
jgi:predicted small lipoprotein YifL